MKLKELLTGLSFTLVKGNLDVEITKIEENLLMLSGGELFPYFSSPLADKLNTLGRAIRKGVRVVVVSSLPEGADIPDDVTMLLTENVRMFTLALVYNALAAISVCRHYGVKNEDIRAALLHLIVKGRMEEVPFCPTGQSSLIMPTTVFPWKMH